MFGQLVGLDRYQCGHGGALSTSRHADLCRLLRGHGGYGVERLDELEERRFGSGGNLTKPLQQVRETRWADRVGHGVRMYVDMHAVDDPRTLVAWE